MPDMNERAEILAIHSAKVHLADDVDLTRVARATPGVSGADLANLVNEAALYAARKGKAKVELEDFEEARDKMLMGVARTSKVISEKDRLATAYHEAGHALLHYLLPNADPLHKVTVVPRGRALGVAISLPEEDAYSRGRGWLLDRIKIAYGGYVAETLVYSETTTGTQNDLKQATELARKMVCDWGMSDLGPVAYGQEDEPIFVGMELGKHRDYSEETSRLIDEEVSKILRVCLQDAEALLREHRDDLEKLANGLVREETLSDEEVRKLLDLQSPASSDDEGA
jgi:cell division protease FtsH